MEWMNRGNRPVQANGQPAAGVAPTAQTSQNVTANKGGGRPPMGGMRWASVALLFSVTILVVALVIFLAIGGSKTESQNKYVDTSKMQAVFLNGGQVYFGNVKNINSQYMQMANIYYLRVNQQVQPNGNATNNDISLVKLGCELHGPQDTMVINQSQIIFWENLKADGQVAKAVADYVKQNPNGQQCNTNTSTGNNSNTGTSTNTGNTTTTTPKKP
jgi:hypothetical protein